MDIYVNNEQQTIESNSSLLFLLKSIQLEEKKGIAVAINNSVIPKTKWGNHTLQPQDKITIIKATQGG